MGGPSIELLRRIPLFAEFEPHEFESLIALFEACDLAPGTVVVDEGERDGGFFVIESGEAIVSVAGEERGRLGAGDYFGDIALIDQRERSATVSAVTEVRCYRLSFRDFRPLVESDARIAWPLLQAMAKRLRAAEGTAPISGPPPAARAWPAE